MGLVGHLSAAAVVRVAALLLFLAAIVGCNSSAAPADPITIRLHTPEGESAGIEVVNVPASVMRSLETRELTREEWAQVLRVSVGDSSTAMLGSYSLSDRGIRFVPAFPLDPGRPYRATFSPAAVPGARSSERKERESNPQARESHPFSRRGTAPVAVLPTLHAPWRSAEPGLRPAGAERDQ